MGREGGGGIPVGEVNGGAVDGLRLTSNAQKNSQNNIPFSSFPFFVLFFSFFSFFLFFLFSFSFSFSF